MDYGSTAAFHVYPSMIHHADKTGQMRTVKTIQTFWYYFRMGHGMYLSFPIGFLGFVVVVYQLALKQIPVFADLHMWGFTLIFGAVYGLAAASVGMIHLRTQSWTETEIAAPQTPYAYKMLPFGKEAKLGMPSSLTNIKIQLRMLQWMDSVSKKLDIEMPEFSEFKDDLTKYRKMTETLLEGGEVR